MAEPSSPSSPRTPATFESSGSTVFGDLAKSGAPDVETDAIEDCPTEKAAGKENDFDPESLSKLPRRATVSESIKRVGTALTEKLPVHWRTNYLAEGRHSQRIDDHPNGYPRLASFMNSDENFLIARRYSLLHTRVMLYRQAELAQLERDLLELDKEDAGEKDRALKGVKFLARGPRGADRKELIGEIEEKLKQYDDIVMRQREMASLPSASTRNYTSVNNYLYHNAPLSTVDQELFGADSDFAALVDPKEAVSLDGFIEDCLSMIPCRATKVLFSTPEQRASTDDKLVHLYAKSLVVLFRAEESGAVKILIILLFTLFFSVALSIFTKAQRHEVFAATAA
ncbi:hypothetical protein LTR36_001443 [Oleoguttula mirabilis]|uniref:DUF6594 domain-containing protein n=1 Tax=Oleoguttula mirabilis TaxID=1507867 RepID=A0AAV9JQJ5_9PEZI|nr:hypothetical protein LTR36_001443 [Oleoguttula mirabilis]